MNQYTAVEMGDMFNFGKFQSNTFQTISNNIQIFKYFQTIFKQFLILVWFSNKHQTIIMQYYFFQSIGKQFLIYGSLPFNNFKQRFRLHIFLINYQSIVYTKVSYSNNFKQLCFRNLSVKQFQTIIERHQYLLYVPIK